MVKEYILEGLCCQNCANKIEASVKSLEGISHANINMITTTLKLELNDGYYGNISEEVKDIVCKYEPDVNVLEKDEDIKRSVIKNESILESKKEIFQIAIGASIFIIGLLFKTNPTIQLLLYLLSYFILGFEVLQRAFKNILKGQIFDENFLMCLATVGAFAIGEYAEASGVMLFYQIGEFFQEMAVKKSRQSIASLMDIRPDYANIKINGEIKKVSPDSVMIGNKIIVKPGEKIPLDGIVVEGEARLDTKAITGEFVPRKVKVNDLALSGCINEDGVITIEVTKTFGESTVSKIIDLVQNSASKKSVTENFITTFSKYYTPAVVILASILAFLPPIVLGQPFKDWINRSLVFLVISCPCALVLSIPLGFFGGIGSASRKGILVKGGNYLEALNKLDTIVFDKTGTLTEGVFKVKNIIPENSCSKDELIEIAALAEYYSNHPIAVSIREYYGKNIHKEDIKNYKEISGFGISVNIRGKNVLIGNDKLMKENGISYTECKDIGTKIYCALDGEYIGSITISDEIKKDSKSTISSLKNMGITNTIMLTGDNVEIAEAIGKELKLDKVYGGLLPEGKLKKLETLYENRNSKQKLAFVGDGINDAPVLKRADIGIAMGALGSDAAIEAADVVLMTDEPSKIIDAIKIAKYTKRIVWQNIIFALGIKAIFLILGAFGYATMWEAVFADVGVALIAILNSMRILQMK